MKGASSDIQNAYKSELERHDLADSGLDVEDEKLILADYNSDDDKNDSDDDEEDVTPEHCTKVRPFLPWGLFFFFLQIGQYNQ